ncbi:MAG: leucine-rich repeat domain-containing protein, partial [Prevotellaceae bacterium]|nr:leucine-rich repeat domain-containing protein [Candidatus Minthosoma caballi]
MKKVFFALVVCIVSISSKAWNNNDHFVWGGIDYLVTDAANFKVKSYKVVDESIIEDGTVTVPHKIKDPNDTNIEWTVTSVRFYEGGKLPASVTKLVISEGIETLESIWQSSGVKEIVFPSTLKNYNHADVYTIQKFTIPDANPYFKFVYYDQEKDENAGFLESKDGKTIYYFVYPATDIYEDANKTVVVANDVITINNNVFNNTPNILTIKLGSSVTTVNAGNSPSQLTAYEVEDGNPIFAAYDGVLYKKDEADTTGETYLLNAFPRGKKGDFTVYEKCTKLLKECLGSTSINTIYLNKVKRVEYNAFRFSSVQRIVIGEDLEYFRNSQTNANFKTFEFQKDIDEGVADMANSTNHAVFNIVDGVLMSKDNKTLISMPSGMHNGEDYTVRAGVTRIEDYAFHYTYIKNFHSNAELTALGTGCFTYTQLETADFSASTNLANVGGLNSSSKLKSVTLSKGVETFGGLTGCSQLEEVHVPDGSKLKQINDNACNGLTHLKKFVFDGSCVASELKIGGRAFSGTAIEEIVLPPNVTSIGTSAFAQCASLKTVTFQETATIKTIATGAFAESSITSIVIPESVTSIGKEAFRSCDKLNTITIPAATISIDPEAFKFCDELTDFIVSKDNTQYSGVDGYLLSKDKKTLVIFPTGKANDRFTLLPPSITKIGDYAFYSCLRLKNVTIPNKVTEIGARAFGLCSNLNTVTFLCDEMIAPAKIDQRPNYNSFDDDQFVKIDINVRASKYQTYTAEETFYNKFKSIKSSFLVDGKNEYIAVSDQSVDLLDIKETAHTYVVPGIINDGTKDWIVSLMGDYACQNAPSTIKEIVMFNNVEYIGAKAFKQTDNQSIENLFFVQKEPTKQLLSTTRFELTPTDL